MNCVMDAIVPLMVEPNAGMMILGRIRPLIAVTVCSPIEESQFSFAFLVLEL